MASFLSIPFEDVEIEGTATRGWLVVVVGMGAIVD